MRDETTIEKLIVLSNMESMNAELIKRGIPQHDRLVVLNKMAIEQMKAVLTRNSIRKLK